MKRLTILALLLSAFSPAPAFAWFTFGHMEVAAIAWDKLSPTARATATRLLKLNPMYPVWVNNATDQERDQIAFIMAATWPDEIKEQASYISDGAPGSDGNRPPQTPEASQNIGYADHFMHKYWHFIDDPFSPDHTKTQPPSAPNAQTQIAAFRAKLSDSGASDDVRSYDLAWLLHLVGDVHQPLHATSRFTRDHKTGDDGGNAVTIQCNDLCSDSELHFFWDDIPGNGTDPRAAAAAAAALPQAKARLASIRDERIWIKESVAAAKSSVYVSPISVGHEPYTITDRYKANAADLANRRIALAGARLANLLNAALK